MKILAVEVKGYIGSLRLDHSLFDIKNKTTKGYRLPSARQKNDLLIDCRTLISKDEIGKIMYDEATLAKGSSSNSCNSIGIRIWVIVNDDDDVDSMVTKYCGIMKDRALEIVMERLAMLKELNLQIKDL